MCIRAGYRVGVVAVYIYEHMLITGYVGVMCRIGLYIWIYGYIGGI